MVVVLAGGMGTRLRKVVLDRPKVIAEINGRPFLYYLLDQMIEIGINQVIVSTGYMADTVEETVGVLYKSLHVDYSKEKTPLGTGGALRFAGQTIDTEYCLVINGDSYTEFDLISLFMAHKQKNANITILVKAVDDSTRFGTIQMNKQNEIIKFMEKGSGKKPGLINAGVYMVNTSIIQKIWESKNNGNSYVELWGDGTPTRDFLYVQDAVRGLMLAAEKYDEGLPINLGSDQETTINELVNLISKIIGFKGQIKWDKSKPNGQPRRKVSNKLAEEKLGFKSETTLEEGLQKTIEWFQKHIPK